MTQGLSHMTFIVRDLDKMEEILTSVLDARKIYDSADDTLSLSKERIFDIRGVWVATMQRDPLTTRTYNHVAFKMGPDEYDDRLARIKALGLEIREGQARRGGRPFDLLLRL